VNFGQGDKAITIQAHPVVSTVSDLQIVEQHWLRCGVQSKQPRSSPRVTVVDITTIVLSSPIRILVLNLLFIGSVHPSGVSIQSRSPLASNPRLVSRSEASKFVVIHKKLPLNQQSVHMSSLDIPHTFPEFLCQCTRPIIILSCRQ
jgi:hypothetical protein